MSEEFVVRKVRRRRLRGKPASGIVPTTTPITPTVPPTPTPVPNGSSTDNVVHCSREDSVLPEYLLNPPDTPDGVVLEGNHTKELVCSYRVAKEVLGSSFRPKESNLAVGKIRV